MPISEATIICQARPGTNATLAPEGGFVWVEVPGTMQLFDGRAFFGGAGGASGNITRHIEKNCF